MKAIRKPSVVWTVRYAGTVWLKGRSTWPAGRTLSKTVEVSCCSPWLTDVAAARSRWRLALPGPAGPSPARPGRAQPGTVREMSTSSERPRPPRRSEPGRPRYIVGTFVDMVNVMTWELTSMLKGEVQCRRDAALNANAYIGKTSWRLVLKFINICKRWDFYIHF